jgi:hypothetical protein
MPAGVTAPETVARARLIALLEAEFADIPLEVRSDRLNESQGQEGPIGAVYPSNSAEDSRDGQVLDTVLFVQLFRQWDNALDPKQVVDPSDIEEWAERLRRAVRADLDAAGFDEHLWYFRVQKIDYNPDPSGNISRLVATIVTFAQNPAIVETAG